MSSRRWTASGGKFEPAMAASLFQNPELLTAWATVGLFAAKLLVGGATCFLIWTGIREMRRQTDREARESREGHEAEFRRHKKAMETIRRRYEEVPKESQRRHEEAMAALKTLIERTAAPAVKGTS